LYSHKVALPLAGHLRIGGRSYEAEPRTARAILDIHAAHYPHHTFWRWATCAGRSADGQELALNLTHNLIRDDATWNENAVWLGGRRVRLGPARFAFEAAATDRPWQLRTLDGVVALTFTPQGARGEDLRLGLVRSVFRQLHGTFAGAITLEGKTTVVNDVFGIAEDHDSLW
jgi:hypothetical protein